MIKENYYYDVVICIKVDLQSYMGNLKLNNRYGLRDYC